MDFSQKDKEAMKLALKEAKESFNQGNLPIGATLVINEEIIGSEGNKTRSNQDFVSHAESDLLRKYSHIIRENFVKGIPQKIELYTTLEPCLMCFGAAVHNKVNRIVYALEDPHGGSTKTDKESVGKGYGEWPVIEKRLMKEEALVLFKEFLEQEKHGRFWNYFKIEFLKRN